MRQSRIHQSRSRRSKHHVLSASILAGCLMLPTSPALADATMPIMTIPDEDIIVVQGETRWRESAPVSGVGIGADTINRLDLDTLDSVAAAVPGLSMINDQDPGTNIVSMRGVTTDRLQQAAVAFVLDDVPLADTEFFTGPLFDVARIDVLRGPQGALYGKNAAGGAIDIRTSRADSPSRFLAVTGGNGQLRAIDAAAGIDVGNDWSVRATGKWSAADGWIRNQTLDRVVDAEETRALRLRAGGPLFGGTVDFTGFTLEEDGGAAWASSSNRVTGDLSGSVLTDPIGDFEGRSFRRWSQVAVRYAASINDALSFDGLVAYDDYAKRWVEELDYRPGGLTFFGAPIFPDGLQPIRQPTDITATTAQARMTYKVLGPDGAEDRFTAGVFGQAVDRKRIDDFGPLLFGANAAAYDTDANQRAVFFAYAWDRPDAKIDVNLRYDSDTRRQRISDAINGAERERAKATFDRWQPRLAGSLKIASGETWVFASYGEGFRSGGFNPAPGPSSVWRSQFDPEVTRSLEVGVKHREGPLRLEAVGFTAKIDNYQNYTFLDGASVTLNVERVDVNGGEASAAYTGAPVLGGELDLGLAAAYADSRIARYIAPDPLIPAATRNYARKRVPNAPLWSAAATADWRGVFADALEIDLGATANATGATVFELDNRLRAPAKSWLDLRARVARGDLSLNLMIRNVTDERWAISGFGQGMLPLLAGLGPDGPFDTFTLNRGRQISLTLRQDF